MPLTFIIAWQPATGEAAEPRIGGFDCDGDTTENSHGESDSSGEACP